MMMMMMMMNVTVDAVTAADDATSWSSQFFVQTLTRMADSSRAKVKEVSIIINFN